MKSNRLSRLRRFRVALPAKTGAVSRHEVANSAFQEAEDMPYAMRLAAWWSWRFLVVAAAVGVLVWLLTKISLLLIPVMIAALISGLLSPVVNLLNRTLRLPRALAVAITVIGFLALVITGLSLAGQRLTVGFAALWNQAIAGLDQVQTWLFTGPLQLTNDDLQSVFDDALRELRSNATNILSEAISWGSALGQIITGVLLALFTLIFLLLDGRKIGLFLINLLPRRARPAMDGAMTRGWSALVRYVRVQLLVAFIDAVGIGFGAFFLGVPLALPLGIIVFIGSFIPIIGALATGALAVLLALVANGWVNALIMLGIVLLVQQAESNILQPLIMGKAVSLHPLAVVLAVAGGTMVAGISGALFAVPIMAVLNAVVKYLARRGWDDDPFIREHYGIGENPHAPPEPDTETSPELPPEPAGAEHIATEE